jgi:phosphomannomutase
MYELLSSRTEDIIIASGQLTEKIAWQSNNLRSIKLGQNGNHAEDYDGSLLWKNSLTDSERAEILSHIDKLLEELPEKPNPDWDPIEDRGAQITFSPVGNTAPVEVKMAYDPDRKKREALMKKVPFVSDTLTLKIGGSTSFDYFQEKSNKGTNVQKLIDLKGWKNEDCVYIGDGLFPGGNDEAVIGIIDTIPVEDHDETYKLLQEML